MVGGLAKGSSWIFQVRAVNSAGPGPWSDPSAAVAIPGTAPGAPTGVAGTTGPGAGEVSLTWTAPVDNGGTPITGYEVESSPATGGPTWTAAGSVTGTGTSLLVTGLPNGSELIFQVRAMNGTGPSAWSDPSAAVTTLPGAPTGVGGTSTPGSTSVSLSWTAPVGVAPITGFEVQKSPAGGPEDWTAVGTVTGSGTTLVGTGLPKGTSWVFRVRALNAGGPGAWSAVSAPVTVAASVPAAPVGPLVGTPGPGSVALAWSAGFDGGSPITGYQVWYRVGSGDPWSLVTWDTGSAVAAYTVTGLAPGAPGYQFAIRANNVVGESNYITSDPGIQPLTGGPATVPAAPVGPLVGTPGPGSVALAWSAGFDGGSPITGYQVWYRVGSGDPWSLVTWDTGSAVAAYTVTGLAPGAPGYQFAIRANNVVGESNYITSDPGIQPLTGGPATVPAAPVGPLVGTPGPGSVALAWSAGFDGGSPITGYQVWYRVGSGDPWSLVTWDTGSAVAAYTVTGLAPGAPGYQFAIRANNVVGESNYITSDPGIQPLTGGPATVPAAPVGPLVGTPGPGLVALAWSAGFDGGSPITGYQVWYRVGSGDPWSLVTWDTGSAVAAYTVTGSAPGLRGTVRDPGQQRCG